MGLGKPCRVFKASGIIAVNRRGEFLQQRSEMSSKCLELFAGQGKKGWVLARLQASRPIASSCSVFLISSSTIPGADMEVEWPQSVVGPATCDVDITRIMTSAKSAAPLSAISHPFPKWALLITGVDTGSSQRWVLMSTSPDPCQDDPCGTRSLWFITFEAVGPLRKPGKRVRRVQRERCENSLFSQERGWQGAMC